MPNMIRLRRTCPAALLIFSLFLFETALGASNPWQELTQTIRYRLNPGNLSVGRLDVIQGTTAILSLTDPQISVGATLAVKGNSLPGVPLSLQDNLARIQVTQISGNQARGTILPGSQKIFPGAPLFPLAHNRVYLYSNLTAPQDLPCYLDLTRALQANQIPYAVMHKAQIGAGETPGIRPLIIALEAAGSMLFCRLTDREQNIFYQNRFALGWAPPISHPAGIQFTLTSTSGSASDPEGRSFTQASGPAPGSQPAGKIELKNPYKRLVFADWDQHPGQELVLLNEQWLEIYRLDDQPKLVPLGRFRLPYNDAIPLHLHAGDFNHNGRDELYVTLGRPKTVDNKKDTALYSLIVENQGTKIALLGKDYPYYFRVLELRDGKRVLLAQEMGAFKQYQVPIHWGGFFQGRFSVRNQFRQARDVFSIYNFTLNPFNENQLLIIDEQGNLAGFNAESSEMLVSCDQHFGAFDETIYLQKLAKTVYEGGFSITKTAEIRYAARRFVMRNSYGRQSFLIKKERVVNPGLVDKGIGLIIDDKIKYDQIIGVQWQAGEMRESWRSPRFPRDIVDFGFTQKENQEVMVVLTRNQNGKYALELLN